MEVNLKRYRNVPFDYEDRITEMITDIKTRLMMLDVYGQFQAPSFNKMLILQCRIDIDKLKVMAKLSDEELDKARVL
jgi:hypothetical protein